MEDAFTLIVLTLLQLSRAEYSKPLPEWYAANLINDANYTPKPLTEIFTTDLSFTPKDEFAQSTPTRTPPPITTSVTTSEATTFAQQDSKQLIQQNIPFEIIQLSKPQQPILFTQTARPYNSDPKLFIIYNPGLGSTPVPITTEDYVTATTSQKPMTVTQPMTGFSNIGIPVNFPMSSISEPVVQTTDLSPVKRTSRDPVISVRMKSPRGTITNILINPPTSTQRSSTTRRRKTNQRRNNYDTCTRSCSDKREPICASPIEIIPINPDKLKGFPSLCHMACHNSFRTQVYDKISDGRCGRLRTRIRPMDKNKLNREELNKVQYTILNNDSKTVMEFIPVSP